MGRLKSVFSDQKAFVAYLTAGDGGIDTTVQAALALVEGGVNILEIGIPFSDPVADGPTIQRAMKRSLEQGTTSQDVFECIAQIKKKTSTPIVLFTYYNPILALGESFFSLAKESGCDGILVVDLPFDQDCDFWEKCRAHGLETVTLLSPNTPIDRILEIEKSCTGFLYYVCRKGTTGVRAALSEDFEEKIAQIKAVVTLPLVAGFGIADRKTAQKVLEYTDGFVVGSAFINALELGKSFSELKQLAATFNG
ncbi:MAG: Tryptophan synthase alpha chain [Chlamydiales bacterium]|nr:Tryptophan synthase alpha chain [Chlamydiales bacterium]